MKRIIRILNVTGIYLMMATIAASPALAAGSKLETAATSVVAAVKILVLAIFGWKAAEMAIKERYSIAWALGLAGALVGGFLFGGETVFTWFWDTIKGLLGG